MSRDSQLFRVPRNISGTDEATNVKLVNKTGNINMRSLTNKTANIKYKKLISLQNSVTAAESHIQKTATIFF